MADVITKGAIFPNALIPQMFDKVKGDSSLAKLSAQTPLAFNGNTIFTFTLDKEVDVVAESGAKTKGGATVSPVTITPVKVEYGARISDEFVYASEEIQLEYLKAFSDGFAKKLARGLDIMAIHGVNPRTGTAASVIGNNCFDKQVTANVVTEADGVSADTNIEAAIAMVQATDNDVSGIVLAPAMRSSLATLMNGNVKMFPELAWGSNPGILNGLTADTNSTISANANKDRAIVGDFANAFKWGFAKEIPLEVIQYGNPDNDTTLGDLKGHNQVYLRAEAYIGWGILDSSAFAIVKAK